MFGNLWNKKEKPLPSWASFGGGVGGFLNAGAEAELEATGGLINEYSPSPTVHYRTHIFTASGALTISAGKLKAFDYWVVAGGGGGGSGFNTRACGGGGGAGGCRYGSFPSVSIDSPIPITIGKGGNGGYTQTDSQHGLRGGSSIMGSAPEPHYILSTGGGGGMGWGSASTPFQPGGSGGGGSNSNSDPNAFSGGAGNTPPVSPSQGNAGGSGSPYQTNTTTAAGGGGGYGGSGSNASSGTGGNGGAGGTDPNSLLVFQGPTVGGTLTMKYGGGGGGGAASTGGSGGGGGTVSTTAPIMSLNRAGAQDGAANTTDGQNATNNSGAGGGGGGGPGSPDSGTMGGLGAPGVVMIRYAIPEAAGSAPTAASGGAISYTPTHTIHTFMYPGVFSTGPTFSKTVEYVVIAGGGGGGRGYAGAGGAGAYLTGTTPVGASAGCFCSVGQGGNPGFAPNPISWQPDFQSGGTGEDSTFGAPTGTITSPGGGKGAGFDVAPNSVGGTGGSGGGGGVGPGGYGPSMNNPGPSNSPGGNIGGSGYQVGDAAYNAGGGGGGAGGVGGDAVSGRGGYGGLGIEVPTTFQHVAIGLAAGPNGSNYWVAGGGAGGMGNTPNNGNNTGGGPGGPYAGGGNGASGGPNGSGADGLDGTGGGGGASGGGEGPMAGGRGGSGLIMIAYPT